MARKKKKPPPKPVVPPEKLARPRNEGSGSGQGWFGTPDLLTDPSSQKEGDPGAGLSAPNWSPDAKPQAKLAPGDAFVSALLSGDRASIAAAYEKVGISDAAAIKSRFLSAPQDQRDTIVKNVDTNKDLFNPIAVSAFKSMMLAAPPPPKGAKPLNFDPVALEGQDAAGALQAMGIGRPVSHTEADVRAMADMAYREARGEGTDGMRGVLHVAVNRVEEAGSRWYQKPLSLIVNSSEFASGPVDRTSPEWQQAYGLAQSIVTGQDPDLTNGATYFANPKTSDPGALRQITNAASPVATIGQHTFYGNPDASPAAGGGGSRFDFASRAGAGLNTSGLNNLFAARIGAAISDAEAATGSKAQITSGVRSRAMQAALYAAYKSGRGGIAAPPGMSLHEQGMALDLGPGPVRDWIQAHAADYGLEAATAYDRTHGTWRHDPPHIQLARDVKATAYDKFNAAAVIAGATGQDTATGGATSTGDASRIANAIQKSGGIQKGSRDTAANRAIQNFLVTQAVGDRIGAPIKVDGDFGNRTKEAVKNYQARNDLKPDGVVGPATFAQMNADMAPPDNAGPELVGADTSGRAFGVGAGTMPGGAYPARTRDFNAGAAAAAVTVDPVVARAFTPSGKATLTAALDHPDEQFVSSGREWDPAAARIANTLRDNERMAAEVQAAKAGAGKTKFVTGAPVEAGVTIPKSLDEFLGGGPGTGTGKEYQQKPEQGFGADLGRTWDSMKQGFDIEHWLQEPTVQGGDSSGMFASPTIGSDPFRPTGGSSGTFEPGNSGSFDDFASGMASTYQAVQSGGSWSQTFFPSTTNYEPGGSNTVTSPTTGTPVGSNGMFGSGV